MSGLDYVHIPHCATPIRENITRAKAKLVTPIPKITPFSNAITSPVKVVSPTKQLAFNFPNLLVSSLLSLPDTHPTTPRNGALLLSTREPLALQTITVNFRRFVSKSGSMFWLQDRIEEIVMWRRGWKVTCTWMAIYTFVCYFPRAFMLLPHVVLISVLLATYENRNFWNVDLAATNKTASLSTQQPKEGTTDWYVNLQAIQNLMGAMADIYDASLPYLPILSWTTSNTSQLLSSLCISLILLIPIVHLIPLRPLFLCLGLLPFALTHPVALQTLPAVLSPLARSLESRAQRMIDNDNLIERHWFADMQEVELWENERWTATAGWSKSNLRADERKPWTRGDDGWSDVPAGGEHIMSNSTFTLSPGYESVETEDWRVDRGEHWGGCGVDKYGWIYTNDSWSEHGAAPNEEWKTVGMTRRRKWTRRICLKKSV